MKNLFFKGLLFSLALFISANVVCADVTDNIPKKINVQGKLTTDSGQPITGSKNIKLTITDKDSHDFVKTVEVNLDSDGLYNADFDFSGQNINFNGPCSFKVEANGVESVSRAISSVPTAFYSSSSTYSLVLDPVNGMKLVDGNFSPTNIYAINVATANYAKKMSTNSDNGYVWGMTSNTEQGWISPGSLGIATASISTLGGIKLANSNTGLSSNISSDSILKVQLDTNAGLKINNSNQITIESATENSLGVVKVSVGNGLSIGTTGADKGKIKMALAGSTPGTMKLYDNITGTNEDGSVTQKAIKSAIDAISYTASNGVEIDNKVIKAVIDSSNANGLSVTASGIKMALAGSTPGTMKLYDNVTGTNTDGSVTQSAIKNALDNKQNAFTSTTKNYVLAGPTSGSSAAPSFRTLVKEDIPLKSETAASGGTTTSLVTTGEKYSWNAKQNAITASSKLSADYIKDGTTNKVVTASDKNTWNGKQDAITASSKLSADYISDGTTNKVVTASDKNTWNGKQDAITASSKLSADYISDGTTNKVVTASDKNTWNGKQDAITASSKLSADYISDGTTNKVVTASDKNKWDGKQDELQPGTGITLSGSDISVKLSDLVDGNTIFVNNGKLSTVDPGGADLAEIYRSKESLQPGDVVSIDTTRDDAIVKTKVAEDTLVAGVISTDPGLLLNSAEKGYKLALVGKVPTKVCNEGGEIKRGDLLVSASIAGYAKKAGDNPKAGTVIGKALENFSSKRGTILVLVNLQ